MDSRVDRDNHPERDLSSADERLDVAALVAIDRHPAAARLVPAMVSSGSVLGAAALLVSAWGNYQGPLLLKVLVLAGGMPSLVCGAILVTLRPDSRPGRYVLIFGAVWYVGILQTFPMEPLHAIGFVGYFLNIVVLAHLALLLPDGELMSRFERRYISFLYVVVPGVQLLRYLQVHHGMDGSRFGDVLQYYSSWAKVGTWLGFPLTVIAVALIVQRWRRAAEVERRPYAIFWAAAAVVGVAGLGALLAEFIPQALPQQVALGVYVVAVMFVPFGVLAGVMREFALSPAAVDALAREGKSISAQLASVLGDRRFTVYEYAGGWWRDDNNRPYVHHADPSLTTTIVSRSGRDVALLVYDRAVRQQPTLARVVLGVAVAAVERRQADRAVLVERQQAAARWYEAQLQERHRIQDQIHTYGQNEIASVRRRLTEASQTLRRGDADRAVTMLNQALYSLDGYQIWLREFAHRIVPVDLEHLGLNGAVKRLALDLGFSPGGVHIPRSVDRPAYLQECVYMIVSEAFSNIVRHAETTKVSVRIVQHDDMLRIDISDVGKGGAREGPGRGLRSIREQVEAFGGSVEVDSPPGRGTIIHVAIPIVLPTAERGEEPSAGAMS